MNTKLNKYMYIYSHVSWLVGTLMKRQRLEWLGHAIRKKDKLQHKSNGKPKRKIQKTVDGRNIAKSKEIGSDGMGGKDP